MIAGKTRGACLNTMTKRASRLDDAARAGWHYYVAGNTQDQIAAKLGVSRQSAQRLVSLARSEGPRDLRVNAVTTPARLIHGAVPAPPPPLASFPGTVEREVAAAAQMLLSGGVLGVTGTVVHADSGRSWR